MSAPGVSRARALTLAIVSALSPLLRFDDLAAGMGFDGSSAASPSLGRFLLPFAGGLGRLGLTRSREESASRTRAAAFLAAAV
jgi:hypothetical protein